MNIKKVAFSLLFSFLYTNRCASKISNLQKLIGIIFLIFFITPFVGCALDTKVKSDFGTKTDSSDSSTNSIQSPQYKIAVVADSKEDKFAKCVERGLRRRLRKSIVISEEKFRDEIYPLTQLFDRPSNAVQAYELLSNPDVNLKMLEIELDFIVYVGGSTNWKDGGGYMTPPAFPLPVWFGYTQKERKTSIRTAILDINKSRLLGNAFVRSKGIVAIPIAGLWLPIPLGLGTESSACKKTAQHIANSLVRKSLYVQTVVEENPKGIDSGRYALTEADSGWFKRYESQKKMIDKYRRLANKDDADAQYNLGLIYYRGIKAEQDYNETIKWWLKASEQGHPKAQYGLGKMFFEGKGMKDYREAARWFKKAVKQGYADVQYRLGYMYYKGLGVEQDYKEAFKWFNKAAEQGYIEGQYSIGYMYNQGKGIQQNYSEAFTWFKRAAEQGYTDAQYQIGLMYYYGNGVPADSGKALHWLKIAYDQGIQEAQNTIEQICHFPFEGCK